MGLTWYREISRGQWMALVAALLGWMFDGLEMGLFPLVARPCLRDLLQQTDEGIIGLWFSVATASFLVGAATGGVLFGWLGDRLGRVRAMTISVLTYAIFSGLCGFATAPWQIAVLRFISALGMGGEWSLGVALVMEIWPDHLRGVLAGLIGAIANLGYLLIALLGYGLGNFLVETGSILSRSGLPQAWVNALVANSGWRLLMLLGAMPALFTFFIRIFVPESERWKSEESRGTTSHWATQDLLGVFVGGLSAIGMIYLWATEWGWGIRLGGSAVALVLVTGGYIFPILRYVQRCGLGKQDSDFTAGRIVRRMLLGATLGGIPLLATWSAIQWAPLWADELTHRPEPKAFTQMASAFGAIVGSMLGALAGSRFGRRITYSFLCLGSLASCFFFFRFNTAYGPMFLASVMVAGAFTASFYGWLPLYLPELFRTSVRATGQGFSFNFGRILAAVGVLGTGTLMTFFDKSYPKACSTMSFIYLLGLIVIYFAPETRGKPLPP